MKENSLQETEKPIIPYKKFIPSIISTLKNLQKSAPKYSPHSKTSPPEPAKFPPPDPATSSASGSPAPSASDTSASAASASVFPKILSYHFPFGRLSLWRQNKYANLIKSSFIGNDEYGKIFHFPEETEEENPEEMDEDDEDEAVSRKLEQELEKSDSELSFDKFYFKDVPFDGIDDDENMFHE